MIFENAKNIWNSSVHGVDEYTEFLQFIDFDGKKTDMRISVCGDYTLYINGKYVSSGQYGDFPHYKIYDEIDITDFLTIGKNTIAILVWYFGVTGMRYLTPNPGLIYEIECDGKIIAESCEKTPSRLSRAYKNGVCKVLTPQLGNSFIYDMNAEDGWKSGELCGFSDSFVLEKEASYSKRPIKKHNLEAPCTSKIYLSDKGTYIAEFDEEIVGLVALSFKTEEAQKINFSYGELLENGHVKRHIESFRDFSFDLIAKPGENHFSNHMLRLACKFIEIESEKPITDIKVSMIPQVYPLKERAYSFENSLDNDIYKICLNTLKLCMMEHYVDCPWREQCLYAFDSRNQMLAGYYAYEDGNYEYARSNLVLLGKDRRPDGLTCICSPSARDMSIPSFTLWYLLEVKEYMEYSGDISLGKEVFEKITDILNTFKNNMENGLFIKFTGESVWNFYDWSPFAEYLRGTVAEGPDALLNIIAIIALDSYAKICEMLGEKNIFEGLAEQTKEKVKENFFNTENGLFFFTQKGEETELINSLAVYSGIAAGKVKENICKVLMENTLPSSSLSFKIFKYEAVLSADRENARYVFSEIRKTYKKMLDAGSTTVWETELGAIDFRNAGSLCHGWSSIPIYYYHNYKDML